jgi:hypothetical protein
MIAPIIARAITPIANVSLNDRATNVGCAVAALASPANAMIVTPTIAPTTRGKRMKEIRVTTIETKVITKDLIKFNMRVTPVCI